VDALGARTTFAHDDADRVTAMTVPSNHVYGFGYDRNGNRTGVTMPDGAAHALGYGAGDRLDRFTPAGSTASQTRAYDADHSLKTTTLPGGRAIQRGYDAGGRPTSIVYPEATAAIAYPDTTGRPSRFTWTPAGGGAGQSVAYAYDADLPTRATYTGTAAGQFDYSYDASRRLSAIKLTSGTTVLDSPVTRDGDGLATAFGPFAFQRNGPDAAVSRIADGALALTLGHDGRGRVGSRSVAVAGQAIYGAVLTRDAAGRITRRVETVAGVTTTSDYSYDADGRLVQVDRGGGPVERYAYDANGNRTSRRLGAAATEGLTYDGQDRLATRGGTTYGSNADGFLSGRGADTFAYSARGELLRAGGVSYVYDGLGRRAGRTQGADATQYLYGNPGDPLQITAVRAPSGDLTAYYYDEDGLLYALQRGAARYYVATDQAGTPRVVTDSAGTVVKALAYDSFGVVTSDSDPGFDLPFGFAGGLSDPVTGLVHFGFRDYEPESGRWTARDPILFRGGQANLYVYAGGDPVGQRDPSGLACIGGSVYAVFGGGGSLCITDEGLSLCAEAGLGFGTGADIDPTGDLADSGTSVLAEASAKWGPLGGKIGAELDSSGCLSGGPEAELGPVKITPDGITLKADIDIETAARDTLFKSAKASVQAKVAAKVCGQLPF
jgi:RHS repeat-associated protein